MAGADYDYVELFGELHPCFILASLSAGQAGQRGAGLTSDLFPVISFHPPSKN
jgi:hypothetical protein